MGEAAEVAQQWVRFNTRELFDGFPVRRAGRGLQCGAWAWPAWQQGRERRESLVKWA